MTGAAPVTGLTAGVAAARLAADGPNALPDRDRRGWWRMAADTVREPMFLLLCGAALLYLLLGEPLEGGFLALMVAVTIGLTLHQQGKTERALQALRTLGSPSALVLRDGRRQQVPARELVAGDVVLLDEGVRIPADAVLLSARGLMVDESLLSGESVPVRKLAGPAVSPAIPGGDDQPWVYSGTLVTQGHGVAQVSATGPRSALGRIGASLHAIAPPPSPLQAQNARLARRFALLGLACSALLVLLLGLRDVRWLDALLAGVALAISVLPEEFTVVLTVFPALGAWRLARESVLTRRLATIETLGAASVLCVDKTGTLTENRMALQCLWSDGDSGAPDAVLSGPQLEVLRWALLATPPHTRDPLELALQEHAARLPQPAPPPGWTLLREYPFTSERRALLQAWQPGQEAGPVIAVKGAPESVIPMCMLAPPQRAAALEAARGMGERGLRVLAVAHVRSPGHLPGEPPAGGYTLAGLCALADPLRPGIRAAVQACHAAGIRVVMLTGDHPGTAAAIASQAGLRGDTASGAELAALHGEALAARLSTVGVCARILPEHKLSIVRALQRGGAVVAMTGDGVNDAPALQAADIGIAMGGRGTDVAREAADLTLLDDRFASIVDAVAAGRRIFANMRKAMAYVAAIHLPITGMALLPALFGWPVMLGPVHIVFLELVINPACAIVFEREPPEPGLMAHPPRPAGSELFGLREIARALLAGAAALALLAPSYALAVAWLPERQARAFGFAAIVLCNLALLLVQRAGRRGAASALGNGNPAFWIVAAAALAMLAAALYLPPMAGLFRFDAPPPALLGAAAALAAVLVLLLEAARLAPRIMGWRLR
ncbi:cation-translocating P-type ATPase [Oxalobacteraceae bacterium A2-2]